MNGKEVLPQDIQVDGFDNIADSLKRVSCVPRIEVRERGAPGCAARGRQSPPAHFQRKVLHRGQPESRYPSSPPGTRPAAIKFKHNFPLTANIASTVNDLGVGQYTAALESASTLVILIDGRIVFRKPIGGPQDQAL